MNDLLNLIKSRVETITKEMVLQTNVDGLEKAPFVAIGYLQPIDPNSLTPVFPYVVIRPVDGSDTTEFMSDVTVRLMIGCYSAEESDTGYMDVISVIEKIRQNFLESRTFDGARLELPLTWAMDELQPTDHYIGILDAKFSIQPIKENLTVLYG